jgi:hypothetical protein
MSACLNERTPNLTGTLIARTTNVASTEKQLVASRFLWALVCLVIINIVLALGCHPDRFELPEHNALWWAVRDFQSLHKCPDIVLFGSSLLGPVIADVDANYLGRPIDCALHRSSSYLEHLLDDSRSRDYDSAKKVDTFSFGLSGEMISDAFAIASTFFQNGSTPRVVVWTVAPRDFIDALFYDAWTSDIAVYMNRISGEEVIPDTHKSLPLLVERSLTWSYPLFRMRQMLSSACYRFTRNLTPRALKTHPGPGSQSLVQFRNGKLLYSTSDDLMPGEALIFPDKNVHAFHDNSSEYQARYHPFVDKTFRAQFTYFDQFLDRMKRLGTKVIVVNMPLTKRNLSLMPAGVYSAYLTALKTHSQNRGAHMYDFNDGSFSQPDFYDTVHLNGSGAKKAVEKLKFILVEGGLSN